MLTHFYLYHRETATVMRTYTAVCLHRADGVATGLAENGSERQSVKVRVSVTVFYGKPVITCC